MFDRKDTTLLGRWWWTVDRMALLAILALMIIGGFLVTAGSPAVAERLHLSSFHFAYRQYVFLGAAILVMVGVSLLTPVGIRRFATLMFLGSVGLMLLVPIIGFETKGAVRWISLFGFSIQPSEFLKPAFAVVIARVFSIMQSQPEFPGFRVSIGLWAFVAFLLLIQPDFGMTLVVTAVWGIQMFLAGLPMVWVISLGILGVVGFIGAYFTFHHVQSRIDRFLDPAAGDNYQVQRSLEAFQHGGLLGQGPGEGKVKELLPDSHTDFIFSVAGEEFGMIFCLLILGLFAFFVLRMCNHASKERDMFVLLSIVGLAAQFGLQAMINMGVAVNLLPAKGMTLPFLSYGGSSLLAIALGVGMLLGLTRKRYGVGNKWLSARE